MTKLGPYLGNLGDQVQMSVTLVNRQMFGSRIESQNSRPKAQKGPRPTNWHSRFSQPFSVRVPRCIEINGPRRLSEKDRRDCLQGNICLSISGRPYCEDCSVR